MYGRWFFIHKKATQSHNVWKSHQKVSLDIASEASYVYILSGQKLIENAKSSQFGKFLKT